MAVAAPVAPPLERRPRRSGPRVIGHMFKFILPDALREFLEAEAADRGTTIAHEIRAAIVSQRARASRAGR